MMPCGVRVEVYPRTIDGRGSQADDSPPFRALTCVARDIELANRDNRVSLSPWRWLGASSFRPLGRYLPVVRE